MAVQITGSQIKNSEIGTSKIQDSAVTTDKIVDSAVTTDKIASAAITSAKLATGVIDNPAKLADNVVTSAKIDLSGTFNFGSGTLQAANPSNSADVATKNYVDSAVSSDIYWKEPCRVATTANIDLSSAPASIDGVTLAATNRVLVKDQSTASQNGVYVFSSASSAMARATDADSASEINGAAVFIKEGTSNADQGFVQTGEVVNFGTDSISWVQFTGLGQIIAGSGLTKTGNQLDVYVGNGIQISSDAVTFRAGAALDFNSGAVDVQVDGTSLNINGDGNLQIKSDGITSSMIGANQVTGTEVASETIATGNLVDACITSGKLGASSVSTDKSASSAVTSDKISSNAVTGAKLHADVAGDGLSQNGDGNLQVNVDDATLEISTDNLQVANLGITASKLASNSVETAKIANANVTGVKLHADVAGDGLTQNGSGNLDVSVGDGLQISGGNLAAALGAGLEIQAGNIEIEVDDASIVVNETSNELEVANLGITAAKLASNSVETAKISSNAVTFAKVAWRMYQELSTISGGSTTTIDLARALNANAVNGVLVFKNGLAMINKTALSGTAANSDEFIVSADGGAGSVARLTFGAALADSDSILIWYLT